MRAFLVATVAVVVLVSALLVSAENKGTGQESWADTPTTTNLWKVISGGDLEELKEILSTNPEYAKVRASDGRGPLFWAYEYGKQEMIEELLKAGAGADDRDADGKIAKEITAVGPTSFAQSQEQQFGGGAGGAEGGGVPPSNTGFDDDEDDV